MLLAGIRIVWTSANDHENIAEAKGGDQNYRWLCRNFGAEKNVAPITGHAVKCFGVSSGTAPHCHTNHGVQSHSSWVG